MRLWLNEYIMPEKCRIGPDKIQILFRYAPPDQFRTWTDQIQTSEVGPTYRHLKDVIPKTDKRNFDDFSGETKTLPRKKVWLKSIIRFWENGGRRLLLFSLVAQAFSTLSVLKKPNFQFQKKKKNFISTFWVAESTQRNLIAKSYVLKQKQNIFVDADCLSQLSRLKKIAFMNFWNAILPFMFQYSPRKLF